MEPVVGIFESRAAAARAGQELRRRGFREDGIQLLLPISPVEEYVPPLDDAERPGIGQAIGGVVGGVAGATAGLGLGALTASFLIPGIGAVAAVGSAAAALAGIAGAIGGAGAGAAVEEATRSGLPHDELYLYEDALSRGKGVLFALVESEEEAGEARRLLEEAGAESLDAARRRWWLGVEIHERGHAPDPRSGGSELAATVYGKGFLSALRPELEGVPYESAVFRLQERMGDLAREPAFRLGFERGSEAARRRSEELAVEKTTRPKKA
jgi:hypothetical protein